MTSICTEGRKNDLSRNFINWNSPHTGCFFSKGPTQKSSKYGIGPSQQDKITKYKAQAWVAVGGGVFEGGKL